MKLFLATLILLFFSGFFMHTNAQQFRFEEPVLKTHNQINIGVFPQVELISIVQTIGNYPNVLSFLMAKDSSAYKTDVLQHFSKFSNHPAVKMFDRLSSQPRMLNFSAPSNIMLYTNEFLQLRTDITPEEFVINRAAGMDSLDLFLELLRDFAIQSSFNDFYRNHRDFYRTITQNTLLNLGSVNYISEMEEFYGKKQKSYNITLVSLYNFVGFGNSLICANDEREIYNTMGPKMVKNDIPFFGDENYLKYLIRHEFSHPFVNPLTEKHWDFIKDFSANYDFISEAARKSMCGDWQECINEFTIRAITTHLACNESEESGRWSYNKESSRGVNNLGILLDRLKYYQAHRDKYPTLDSYYTEILDVFRKE
jgi:hypothetical protein